MHVFSKYLNLSLYFRLKCKLSYIITLNYLRTLRKNTKNLTMAAKLYKTFKITSLIMYVFRKLGKKTIKNFFNVFMKTFYEYMCTSLWKNLRNFDICLPVEMKINKIRFFLHFYVLYGINKKNSFKFNTKWQTNFTHERIIIHFSTKIENKRFVSLCCDSCQEFFVCTWHIILPLLDIF